MFSRQVQHKATDVQTHHLDKATPFSMHYQGNKAEKGGGKSKTGKKSNFRSPEKIRS